MGKQTHRYLVITELFLPTKGGTAVWFDEVYRRLGGKETHIVTADVPGGAEHDYNHPNSVHRVSLRRHGWLRPESLAMYAKLLSISLAVALRHGIEAVHAGRVLPEGLVGWVVARLIRRPLVIYAHGEEITTWRQGGKRRAMVFAYRRADRVVANSEFTRAELLKLGVENRRIAVIYPGVNVEHFRPGLDNADLRASLKIGARQKLVLSVGRLSRRKGFDQLIRSVPALLARGIDVHYALIGTGEDREYLARLAQSLETADRIHFLGHVAAADLPRWYNAADVVAMPNREINGDTEGFGMVFLEAAACGKPVLAGRAGGTGAAVIDGVTGLRVDGEAIEDVTVGLQRLLVEGAFARRLGQNGSERAHRDFAWQEVAKRTLALEAES